MTLRLPRVVAGAALLLTTLTPLAPAVAVDQPPDAQEGRCEVGRTQLVSDPTAMTNVRDAGFPDAWREGTGKGVRVAVVDTGVDTRNQHLRSGVEPGRSFIGGSATEDPYAHGTALAGIIAARRASGSVLIGAAPEATIVPVRVLGEGSTTADVAAGIRWAAQQGVDVINVSLTTGSSDKDLPILRRATELALRSGAIVVAASGNTQEDAPFTQVQYPAGFDGVVGVAATNAAGAVDDWSVHGPHVDVAAPGANVLTAFRSNGDCLVGLDHPYTSYATGYVSALAAMLVQRFQDDSPRQVVNRLLATADRPVEDQRDDTRGWGTIQPVAAMTSTSNAAPGTARAASAPQDTKILPTVAGRDPLDRTRHQLAWWLLGAAGATAVALVLAPWARRRRRLTPR